MVRLAEGGSVTNEATLSGYNRICNTAIPLLDTDKVPSELFITLLREGFN